MRKLTAMAFAILATIAGWTMPSLAQQATHKVAIQVNTNDPATMNLALNNAQNIISFYKQKNETVDVQVVTYGPGLHMLRDDTSPVKQRIATMSLENQNLKFAACGNTHANMSKAENKKPEEIKIISEAKMVPSGVITLMELQKQGYAYIRP
jgi:uncharacterized protein